MHIAIVGGGICGLSLALKLHKRGISCHLYERAPEIREIGVGITLLPHAMREFVALGVGDELLAAGIENVESCFFNRFGQPRSASTADGCISFFFAPRLQNCPPRGSAPTTLACAWTRTRRE